MATYWPVPGTTGSQIQSYYQGIRCQIMALEEKEPEPKPFLKTHFGQLARELREKVFSNLLVYPPAFAGHKYCIKYLSTEPPSQISVDSPVDLKESHTSLLRTCRQIYLEAFPVLYANRFHYLANSQDNCHLFSRPGPRTSVGSQNLRVDTITSLCFENLVIGTRAWCPETFERLFSQCHYLHSEELEARRDQEMDLACFGVHLMKMMSLRKMRLCTRAGHKKAYFEFVSNTRGLSRGAVRFVDKFHWTIRSQSSLEDGWKKFQNSDFPVFSLQGQKPKQSKSLGREPSTSGIVIGDGPWVEVDTESRHYDHTLLEARKISSEGSVEAVNDTSDGRSDELQAQADEGDKQEHEREHLQGQQLSDNDIANTENGPDQADLGLQDVAVGDSCSAQATLDPGQGPGTLQKSFDQDYSCTLGEADSEAELEAPSGHIQTGDLDAQTALVSQHESDSLVGLLEKELDQARRRLAKYRYTNLEALSGNRFDAQLRAETDIISEKYSGAQDQAHHNVQIDAKDQDGQQILDQPEQFGKQIRSKLLPVIGVSSNPQQPTEKPIEPPIPGNPETPLAKANSTEVSDLRRLSTLRHSTLGWLTIRDLSKSIRVAAQMLALCLINTFLQVELEDTIGRFLALELGVLLTLLWLSSKERW